MPANSISVLATQTRRLSRRERRLAISWIVSLGIESKLAHCFGTPRHYQVIVPTGAEAWSERKRCLVTQSEDILWSALDKDCRSAIDW